MKKIIKYLAIAAAIFIIMNIIFAIFAGISVLGIIFGINELNKVKLSYQSSDNSELEITEGIVLDVDLESSSLEIKKGEELSVESDNKFVNCTQDNNKIIVKEESNWFNKDKNGKVIIYVPEDTKFAKIDIETDAGSILAEKISAERLSLEVDSGKAEIQEINVLTKTDIEVGSGQIDILAGEAHNLDLDINVGKITMTTKLVGNNEIDQDSGELNLNLTDEINNYTIIPQMSFGKIKVNGTDINSNNRYGEGENTIRIEAGAGNTYINTK